MLQLFEARIFDAMNKRVRIVAAYGEYGGEENEGVEVQACWFRESCGAGMIQQSGSLVCAEEDDLLSSLYLGREIEQGLSSCSFHSTGGIIKG